MKTREGSCGRSRRLWSIEKAALLILVLLALAGACCSAVSYKLPYSCGESYVVTQGNNSSTRHTGKAQYAFDFGMPVGREVVAVAAGTVVIVEDSFTKGGNDPNLKNFANRVVIEHDDGYSSLYLHLQHNSAVVTEGQRVYQGQPIAKSGRTGYVIGASGAHLHFQLQQKGIWWEQSVPVSFSDVTGGVPTTARSYSSDNCASQTSSNRSLLSRRLELAAGFGVDWSTDDDFNPVSEDPWWTHAQIRTTFGIDALAIELILTQHASIDPVALTSRTIELGFSSKLNGVSLSTLAAAWIEPYLLGWVHVALRGDVSKWTYWEFTYSIPILPETGPCIKITFGAQLKIF